MEEAWQKKNNQMEEEVWQQNKNNEFEVNRQANNGQNGQDGKEGKLAYLIAGLFGNMGQNGANGQNGGKGDNAQDVHIQIQSNQNQLKLTGPNIYQTTGHGDPRFSVKITSQGGRGGNGGNGGHGEKGQDGQDGKDATKNTAGTNGQNGGNGGNGGDAGQGGDGGNGGDVRIVVSEKDMDYLLCFQNFQIQGGQGGEGGQRGRYGNGGKGGREGRPYGLINQTDTYLQPGGIKGLQGNDGNYGKSGRDGKNGREGTVSFYITELNQSFSNIYNLEICNGKLQLSDDLIYEPGEVVCYQSLSITNRAKMPTPKYQPIKISIEYNKFIDFKQEDEVFIDKQVFYDEIQTTYVPLKFKLKNIQNTSENLFKQHVPIHFQARMSRSEKMLNKQQFSDSILVTYPVQISNIVHSQSISLEQECPFVVGIKNHSQKDIGSGCDVPRILRVRMIFQGGEKNIAFLPRENILNDFDEIDQFHIFKNYERDIEILPKQESSFVEGIFKFVNQDIQPYSKANFQVQLLLGAIENPKKEFNVIQVKNFSIQLCEAFTYQKNSNFLLVINNQTEKQVIDQWKLFANSLGNSIDIWNASNYQGFSFFQYLQTYNSHLCDLYQNKVVIIYNNKFKNDYGEEICVLNFLEKNELFLAAKYYNIATYIIGDSEYNFDLNSESVPVFNSSKSGIQKQIQNTDCKNLSEIFTIKKSYQQSDSSCEESDMSFSDKYLQNQHIIQQQQQQYPQQNQKMQQEEEIKNEQDFQQQQQKNKYQYPSQNDQDLQQQQQQQQYKELNQIGQQQYNQKEMDNDNQIQFQQQVLLKKKSSSGHQKKPVINMKIETVNENLINSYSEPTVKDIIKKADQILFQLRQKLPFQQHFLQVQLKPSVFEEGWLFTRNTWNMGQIQLIEGLSSSKDKIAFKLTQGGQSFINIDNQDKFISLKLLPFSSKINILERVQTKNPSFEIVVNSIIADLVDEIYVIVDSNSDLDKKQIQQKLQCWNIFTQTNFNEIIKHQSNPQEFIEMMGLKLYQFEFFILNSLYGIIQTAAFFITTNNKLISEITASYIDNVIKQYFNYNQNEGLQQLFNQAKQNYYLIKFKQLETVYGNQRIEFNNRDFYQKIKSVEQYSKYDKNYNSNQQQPLQFKLNQQRYMYKNQQGEIDSNKRFQTLEEFQQKVKFEDLN